MTIDARLHTAIGESSGTSPDAALRVRGLRMWYERRLVLDGIDLDLPRRCITALIGPSGCGKSSLLRCLNRLNDEVPGFRMEGRVQLGTVDAYARDTDVHELRRRVGMVFQRPNPFPLSVQENVAYGLRLLGLRGRAELEPRVESALRAVGLWDEVAANLHGSALELSFGQQQRLVLARAIAIEPDVLLLDEPASALDPAATLHFEELLRQLAQRYTLLLVTHNMQQAARIADYAAFMDAGRIVEFGGTDVLFTNPRERLTEDFITGRHR